MTQKEMIEIIQQHHPSAGETMLRKAINRAQDDFSAKTDILTDVYTATSVANKRFYPLHPEMLKIKKVDIDGDTIQRLLSAPVTIDLDLPTDEGGGADS